ncbi:bifunctional GNAT family N-acetyltransferase/carbon-nitrogen hydrolase family protein [Solitalea koreensis]|uniref:Predicted amidohydrolase n=1 Tax=Solitalea koreensis TaxID=543615 RepID=A0A521E7D4_9SPHI|nr:bifunctional GNAT family N-acetyltransferase/carbon-nitrogen hydrolase family protein [Solitalea koreensis]SMO79090.1 Predicted amidohydrolase [Solitalea koreensis]
MENLKIEIVNLRIEDYYELKESMLKAYAQWGSYWKEERIKKLLTIFPEGQICVKVNDKVVGCALSIIVDYDRFGDKHSYEQITGNYSFSTHDPQGNVLYGIEVFIQPDYRGKRLARRLYNVRKELCEQLNLKAIIAGGRIPNFIQYAATHSTKEYIEKVKSKEIYDPTLTFQLSNGFHVRKILKDYMPGDKESLDYAALIEWNNIYYEPKQKLIGNKKSNVRLGLIQWQMRSFKDFDAVCEQIEFFVDAASGYESDFILFPEYFHAPLMAEYNHLLAADAVRKLADYTEILKEKFVELAIKYNANIITGSMPSIRDGKLLNIGFLCHRNGMTEQYEKLHVTPDEKNSWGMSGGNLLKTYDTDCGKIGILICYDVEFPELSRILADEGMKILFVPFSTDTQSGYIRVRHCSMARAIENECFVAIAGSVGNLPKVHNMDIQYARSAVFTPSDFAFPHDSIKSEATPNTEMTLIVDVDLDLLKDLHYTGSVRTLTDRRRDLYSIQNSFPLNRS